MDLVEAKERGFRDGVRHPWEMARVAVVRPADFVDPTGLEQALDRGVKRRRPHLELIVGELAGLLHNGVAVFVAGRKGEKDEEGCGWKRQVRSWHDPLMIYHLWI